MNPHLEQCLHPKPEPSPKVKSLIGLSYTMDYNTARKMSQGFIKAEVEPQTCCIDQAEVRLNVYPIDFAVHSIQIQE